MLAAQVPAAAQLSTQLVMTARVSQSSRKEMLAVAAADVAQVEEAATATCSGRAIVTQSLFHARRRNLFRWHRSAAGEDENAPAAAAKPQPEAEAMVISGRGGEITRGAAPAAATAGAPATPRRVMFTVRMEIDTVAERKQVFEEAWRTMKNRFFDPKMHGVDWARRRATYEAMLPIAEQLKELHNVIAEMKSAKSARPAPGSPGRAAGDPSERIQALIIPASDLVAGPETASTKFAWICKKGPPITITQN